MRTDTRLRQIAFASDDLAAAAAALHAELGLDVAHRDPWVGMFGLANVVMPVGDQDFLEVVSPITEDASARRYLDRNGGDGGYMLIFESADLKTLRTEVDELGIRIVQAVEDEQHTSLQLHPKDCDGIMLSLDSASQDWLAAGPDWRQFVRTDVVSAVKAIEFAVDDPPTVAAKWVRITGARNSASTLNYTNLDVRLVPVAGGRLGLRSIEVVRGPNCPRHAGESRRICGVDFVFVEAEHSDV